MTRKLRLGEILIQGLREAVAYERGEKLPGVRVVRRLRTAPDVVIAAAPEYSANRIARLRARLKFSQTVFAQTLNVSPETVRAWEQGKRTPDGATLRLLEFSDKHPQLLMSLVRSA